MSWRTPITLVVLLGVLLGAAFYGWNTIISPAREDDKDNASTEPSCDKVDEFERGQVIRSSDLVVNVYNAGSRSGLAGETLDRLSQRGFKAGIADNAPAGADANNVSIVTGDKAAPDVKLVASQFKGAVKFIEVDGLGDGINVIVGDNFKGVDASAKKKVKIKEDVTTCSSTDETDGDSAAT